MEQRIVPRQGEVWDIDFDPIRGHERGGRRPALVISHNRFNQTISAQCLVIPFASRQRGTTVEFHMMPPEGGLNSPSALVTNQAGFLRNAFRGSVAMWNKQRWNRSSSL